MITFFVPGIPAPQGSKRAFVVGKRAVLVESSKACKPWRDGVRAAAMEAMRCRAPLEGPLRLDVAFYMPRPRSAPKERRGWPCGRPDRDKLLRSTCDGLTGVLYRDDSQPCTGETTKCYVGSTQGRCLTPGAWIRCEPLPCGHGGGANKRGRCVDCGEVM